MSPRSTTRPDSLRVQSFAPITAPDSQVLILGSMPGKQSLEQQQYYANPNNSFWYIMGKLLDAPDTTEYTARIQLLLDNRIALWDVLGSCERSGSLDSSIATSSAIVNDFVGFFNRMSAIRAVFFNGAVAEKEFSRKVRPTLPPALDSLGFHRLPSTSPAMATLSREQKLTHWTLVLRTLTDPDPASCKSAGGNATGG